MSKCPNNFWFGKHKYQGRYDETANDKMLSRWIGEGLFAEDVVAMMRAAITHTYVCDICVHCGDKIVR